MIKIHKRVHAFACLAIALSVASPASTGNNRTGRSAGPLAIRADNPLIDRTPVFLETSRTIQPNTLSVFLSVYTVPRGKWLVVEAFFMHGYVRSGQHIVGGFMDHLANNAFSPRVPMLVHEERRSAVQSFEANLQGPFYFESGSQVFAEIQRSASKGGGLLTAGISGYLVNQP